MKNCNKRNVRARYPHIILAFTLTFFLGCSTTNRSFLLIDSFSDATVDFAERATKAYELIEEGAVDRKIIEIATLSDEDIEKISRETFTNITGILEKRDAMGVRKEVLALLGRYAEALGALGASGEEDEIKEASRNLYSALVGLDTTSVRVLGRQKAVERERLKIIAAELDAASETVTRGNRTAGIRRIVIQSDSTIQLACKLLGEDIASIAELARADLDTEIAEWIRFYKIRAPKLNFEQRIKLARKVYAREKMSREAEPVLFSIAEASKRVARAHSALKKALIRNRPRSGDVFKEIDELLSLTAEMDRFYQSLE